MRYRLDTLLPEEAFRPVGKKMRLYGGGGGGSSQPSQTTATQTSYTAAVQPELVPYAENIAQQSQVLGAANYQPYQGSQVAGFTPLQQQQQSAVAGLQTPGQYAPATGLNMQGGVQSLNAGQNFNATATDPNAMGAYMSPYWQNAVTPQINQAIQNYQRTTAPQEMTNATAAGAFGGSREAIQQGVNQGNLNLQLQNIEGTGAQNAYTAAEQAAQFGTTANLQGANQAETAGSNLANIGTQQNSATLNNLNAQGTVGNQQQALNQSQMTTDYQNFLKQQEFPYSQLAFENSMVRGLTPALPQTTSTYTAQPPIANQVASLGLGAAGISSLLGSSGGAAAKKGGRVKAFAAGGSTGGAGAAGVEGLNKLFYQAKQASPQQIASSLQGQGPFPPLIAEMAQNYQGEMRTAAQGVQAAKMGVQPSVKDKMLMAMNGQQVPGMGAEQPQEAGVGGLPAPNMQAGFAEGGIIGFDDGGLAPPPMGNIPADVRFGPVLAEQRKREQEAPVWDWKKEAARLVGEGLNRVSASVNPWSGTFDTLRSAYENRPNILRDNLGAGTASPAVAAAPAGPGAMRTNQASAAPASAAAPMAAPASSPGGGAAPRPAGPTAPAAPPAPASAMDGIAGLQQPTQDQQMDSIKDFSNRVDDMMSPEKKAYDDAYADQKARFMTQSQERLKNAQGLAMLAAAQALVQPGRSGITSIGDAFGAVGGVAQNYQALRDKAEEEQSKADIAHAQGILALKQGNMKQAADLAEKRQDHAEKAYQLTSDAAFHKDVGTAQLKEAAVKEGLMQSEINKNNALAAHGFASASAVGAQAKQDAQFQKVVMAAQKQAANDVKSPMHMAKAAAYPGGPQAYESMLADRYVQQATGKSMLGGAAPSMQLQGLPAGATVTPLAQ